VETKGAAPANGRFPVAFFVHGFGAHADNLYLHYWAAAGFIAVSIKFPLTNTDTPGGPKQADLLNEPGDVSFVLSRIAHLPARDADLQPIIDATRVGLMGQSLGATVVFDLGFNKRYHDPRIKAVVPMSGGCVPCGPGIGEGDGVYFTGPSLPVMFIHGTADPAAPIEHSAQEYAQAPAPKFFVRMIGALHVQFGPPWDQVAAHATIAPISESVALTLNAVKMYGSAFGTRTFAKMASSLAAYDRMSSRDAWSTSVSPRSVLIMIGKNTRTATTIIFESGFRIPNQLFMTGANAMIGTEFAAIANGSRERLAVAQRAVANATTSAATPPIRRPPTASTRVFRPTVTSSSKCSTKAAAIELGGGNRNCWIPNARTASSQSPNTPTNTATAGRL